MWTVHRLATLLVDGLCRIVGRQQVARASRFTLKRARLDVQNTIQSNAESQLPRDALLSVPPDEPITVFDVRANMSQWSLELDTVADDLALTHRIDVHAFEPSAFRYHASKHTPAGVEAYPEGWDPDLETFVEGGYLAWDPAQLSDIKVIPWWKAAKR